MEDLKIQITDKQHLIFAEELSLQYAQSAKVRGTGISMRSVNYLSEKIKKGNAVIALSKDQLCGFCYIENFESDAYVSNSGLIVLPRFRGRGLASKIKQKVFDLARNKYPKAKIFGITTSSKVMKINSDLGYLPVALHELTNDMAFWEGCSSCSNYNILTKNNYSMCLCTAMVAPSKEEKMKLSLSAQIINQNIKK